MNDNLRILEKHVTVQELASAWGLSADTVRRWFADEPDVLCGTKRKKSGRAAARRPRRVLRIPVSVAERVYRQKVAG